jgi:hypothetical protein
MSALWIEPGIFCSIIALLVMTQGGPRGGAVRSQTAHDQSPWLEFNSISRHRLFIPFQADARRVRNAQHTIDDLIWLLQNRFGLVLPFQPMRRLRDTHDVSAELGIKVGGDRDARRSSDRRCPEPSSGAADAHDVRHH